MKNYHGKILSAYDCFGRFKGIIRCDHERNGFHFVPAEVVAKIRDKLVNMDDVKRTLLEEGLKESNHDLIWKRWYKFIEFNNNIRKFLVQTTFSIRCLKQKFD